LAVQKLEAGFEGGMGNLECGMRVRSERRTKRKMDDGRGKMDEKRTNKIRNAKRNGEEG